MIARIFWIEGLPSGRLGIALRPRGAEWLEDEVRALRAAGVDSVVSLLTAPETRELGLEAEEALCRHAGLGFHCLAIPDRGVPASPDPLRSLASAVRAELEAGKTVAVHCRQGVGRSALAVGAVLILMGEVPARALRRIEESRGCPVPDTPEQEDWLRRFAQTAGRKAA
jgi:protein-tyrosine phosphatase